MAQVKFENVDKVFDNGVKAVSNMSLEVRDGEFLVLVGPSGCGKTTALRMVAGLEAISSGTVSIGDTVVNNLSSKDRDIAMVFQNYALYPHLSVADNIAFGLRLRKEPKEKINKQVEWAATMLDLVPYLNRRPKELSGGQRQRVAMGRAIVREPKVFLMDEPLSNLDAKLRVQMRAEIANLQKQLGTTTIYVTHDQVEAMTMGDRVAVMSMGVLQQVAEPQVLYDAPANIFVAGFIGTPPMNMFEATVEKDGDYLALTLAGARFPLAKDRDWRYPRLSQYAGRKIVVGIRAEDVHAAEAKPGWPSVVGRLGLMEALGSSQMGYLNIDATKVAVATQPKAPDDTTTNAKPAKGAPAPRPEDLHTEAASSFVTNLVAIFPPRLPLKLNTDVRITIDTANIHFFDADSGEALR
ncbi:MAG: ABC transporter ATP-binding protein [Ilumatobacteraceae bacterium]|nr:sn-glycerol-3-phosphate ABC transporter ATP-binding protein UgpC [Acidimicrobiia bacterium]NCZ55467.1 sn-glycerol-3-phosphate ABC transporter ATP-binding protein UgpC [Acidimicrobiia bacterium]NDA00542.1 sn-glycerol-3-phosphate ABC transporter ATP-binding protein UgpC [Acidimicrobiia bacterium]